MSVVCPFDYLFDFYTGLLFVCQLIWLYLQLLSWLSGCLSIWSSTWLYPGCLFVCQLIWLSLGCLFVCQLDWLFLWLLSWLSLLIFQLVCFIYVDFSIFLFSWFFANLSIYLIFCISVCFCLFVCLCVILLVILIVSVSTCLFVIL